MQCHEFNERLHAILDERALPESDPILSRHAADCSECAERLAMQRMLLTQLNVQPAIPLPADFANRVVDQVEVSRPVRPNRQAALTSFSLHWTWGAVSITALAVACLLWFSPAWNATQLGQPTTDASAGGGKRAETLAISQSQPTQGVRSRSTEIETAKSKSSQQPASVKDNPGDYDYENQIRQWVHTLPDAVERMEEMDLLRMEEYAPGLRSLRTSFALALDTLRRSMPGHRESEKLEGAWRILPVFAPA